MREHKCLVITCSICDLSKQILDLSFNCDCDVHFREAVTRAVAIEVEVLRTRRQARDAAGDDVTHPDVSKRGRFQRKYLVRVVHLHRRSHRCRQLQSVSGLRETY